MGAVTSAVEEVIYSIQIKTSDKLFAGTDNDIYLRIGCVNYYIRYYINYYIIISQTHANIDEVFIFLCNQKKTDWRKRF